MVYPEPEKDFRRYHRKWRGGFDPVKCGFGPVEHPYANLPETDGERIIRLQGYFYWEDY